MSAVRKPPRRTGTPRARWSGERPAARPARAPPVPQAIATTSACPDSSSPSARHPVRRGCCCRPQGRRTRPSLPPPAAAPSASLARPCGGTSTCRRSAAACRPPRSGPGRGSGAVGQFLAADQADRGQAEEAARGRRGAQVVGVRAARVRIGRPAAAVRFGASLRHLLPTRFGWIRSSRLRRSRTPRRVKRSSSTSCSGDGSRGRRVVRSGTPGLDTVPLSREALPDARPHRGHREAPRVHLSRLPLK